VPMFERVSGSWKEITSPSERSSSVWKSITGGWVNVSGTWKRFYTRFSIDLSNFDGQTYTSVSPTISVAEVGVQLRTDGSMRSKSGSSPFNYSTIITDAWGRPLTADIGDDYEVRLDVTSGDSVNEVKSDDTAVWLALTSDRTWEYAVSGGVIKSGTWRVRIRDAATSTVVADASATFTANSNL